MKNPSLALALAVGASVLGCVSLTPGGAKVQVYETDRPAADSAAQLPQGCRLLGSEGPIDQQAPERLVDDPYRVQRNATAERGGNVLLLRSRVLKSLPKTECAPGDRSVDCQETLGTWYRVAFESYACDDSAREALARAGAENAPNKIAWWWPFGPKEKPAPAAAPAASASASSPAPAATHAAPAPAPAPAISGAGLTTAELKTKILALMRENVSADVIVAYVRSQRVAAPLTAEQIIDWKSSGIAEPVIEAAISRAAR